MNIKTRFALWLAGGLGLILSTALLIMPLLIDPNEYIGKIEETVQERTGHALEIDENLSLSLFPWIGVETGKVTVLAPRGFGDQALMTFPRAQFRMELFPLFSGRIIVKQARLFEPEVNLIRNADGIGNWEGSDDPEREPAKKKIPLRFSNQDFAPDDDSHFQITGARIDSVAIRDGRIRWTNLKTEKKLDLRNIVYEMDRFAYDAGVDFSLSGELEDTASGAVSKIEIGGRVIVEPGFNVFKLERFSMNSEYRKTPQADPFNYALSTNAILNIRKQTLVLYDLDLDSSDILLSTELSSTHIFEKPVFSGPVRINRFNIRKLAETFDFPLPDTRDSSALSSLRGSLKLKSTPERLNINGISLQLDDSTFKGAASIKNFSEPAVTINLNSKYFNLERYLPAEFSIADSADSATDNKPETSTVKRDSFPLEAFRNLNLYGIFNIRKLAVADTEFEQVQVALKCSNLVIRSNQRIRKIYDGRFRGAAEFNFRGPVPIISLYDKFSGIRLGRALQDFTGKPVIGGKADGTLRLVGRGKNMEEFKSTLNGDISGNIADGHLQGIDLPDIAATIATLAKDSGSRNSQPADRTDFSSLQFSATVSNGIVNNHSLKATSGETRFSGHGELNLRNDTLDYLLIAEPVTGPAPEDAEKPEKEILIGITGTPGSLKYQPGVKRPPKKKEVEKPEPEVRKAMKRLKKDFGRKRKRGVSEMINELF